MSVSLEQFVQHLAQSGLLSAVGVAGSAAVSAKVTRSEGHEPPATTGKRLALVIDLRKFAKDDALFATVVEACHKAHSVPDFGDDAKNEVKWIWTEPFETAFHSEEFHYIREDLKGKPTLLLCNHCDNPPCTRVCPTQATWKRAEDGVVMMDWHRCIGCRYCVVACPYGSRSFNWRDPRPAIAEVLPEFPTRMRGVVEKCSFCVQRIKEAHGKAKDESREIRDGEIQPACVQTCPTGALVFGNLMDQSSRVRRQVEDARVYQVLGYLNTKPAVFYLKKVVQEI